MNKQKWTERLVTWGGYFKLCGVLTVISTIFGALYCIALYEPAWWTRFKTMIQKPFVRWICKKDRF